ncbi:hypothetical protein [Kocuria massiliensis]|uniref:hypothetical protein n=1 Tax=Kocuria massiliensis TaxID=1926282 RepID=UPI000A1CD73B|nr:hypothetical protein [Kocuria massiliensis]
MRTTKSHHFTSALAAGGGACLLAVTLAAGTPALAEGTDAPQASTQQEASPQLPTIEDTWSGTWNETTRQVVNHPKFGELEIRTYFLGTPPTDTSLAQGAVGYAVYQNGRAVGFSQDNGTSSVPLTDGQPDSVTAVNFADTNVDREGNVYFTSGASVVVLRPTDNGYTANQTLPNDVNQLFTDALELNINEDGVASIVAIDENGVAQKYTMKGGHFSVTPA